MRTTLISATLLVILFCGLGCEKTIREARQDRNPALAGATARSASPEINVPSERL